MINSNHNNLFWPGRDEYTGWVMSDALVLGESFEMDSIQAGRLWTTPVTTIVVIQPKEAGREIVRFRTKNSEYELETEELNGD